MSTPEPEVEPDGLSDDAFHERLRRNQRIQDTAGTPGWAELAEVAKEKLETLQHKLAFGGCASWEDYLKTVAEFRGVSFVLDIPRITQANVDGLRAQRVLDEEGGE